MALILGVLILGGAGAAALVFAPEIGEWLRRRRRRRPGD